MKKRVERLRGMYDLLPGVYQQQQGITQRLGAFLARAGYMHVDTPLLEHSDLFAASFGQELWQNLYTFRLHHRELCLRPEYTASICRLYLDSYQQHPLPLRFQYAGPVFRYESPGRSRYRQHTQLGIELFGGQPTSADAEMLQLACDALQELSIPNYRLELGHIGVAGGFIQRLNLDEQAARLLLNLMEQISRSDNGERLVQQRLEALYPAARALEAPADIETRFLTSLLSGLNAFSGDDESRQEILERFLWKMGRGEQRRQMLRALEFLRALHDVSGSPPTAFDALRDILARYDLDASPLSELEQLVTIIEQCGVAPEQITLNLALGRGVSYYTGLVFEIHARDVEGYDAQICGGGRYDSLVRAIGGARDVRACGFAFGIERLLAMLPLRDLPDASRASAIVIPVSARDVPYALQVARTVRAYDIHIEVDISGHGVGNGLERAAKKHAPFALIVGDEERQENSVTLRNLLTGDEQRLDMVSAARNLQAVRP